ncbi:hypothetical protein RBB50_010456 [Rhinocladiella similis]
MLSTLVIIATILPVTVAVYRVKFHRLSHLPGPWFASIGPFFLYIICYLGIEAHVMRHYHDKYKTKTLRVGTNSVSISDPSAIHEIYVAQGGFVKDNRYANFNMGPVVSIFSALDVDYRNVRAKSVALLFAPGRLRKATQGGEVIGECIREFMDQFRALKGANNEVDILDLCARLSIDVVTGYLLGRRYNGLHEDDGLSLAQRKDKKLSANPFVFSIVAFARFSLFPNWLFKCTYAASTWWASSPEVDQSFKRLGEYSDQLMEETLTASPKDGVKTSSGPTYQGRLLAADISPFEAKVQAQATIFAGADSTAIVLATILFHLVQYPDVHKQLYDEVESEQAQKMDASQLPYLRAVVKEGLRLGMTNPTRLTRVVPPSGLQVYGQTIPAGTVVGCAAYVLHHDAEVFDKPFDFQPGRWLDNEEIPPSIDGDEVPQFLPKGHRDLMEKHMMPFGLGLRACLGKNLALQEIHEAVRVVVASKILEGATTVQDRIKMKEWFNGEIHGHRLEVRWR